MRVRGIGIPLARSLSIFHRNCKTVFKKVLLVFSASKYFEAGLPRSYLSHYHCFISCRAGRNGAYRLLTTRTHSSIIDEKLQSYEIQLDILQEEEERLLRLIEERENKDKT